MDKYLGKYLESLKEYPWYDQCTVIITADHKPNGPKLNCNDHSIFAYLPIIIINPTSNYQGIDNHTVAQSSLFPTIIDLYHISTE